MHATLFVLCFAMFTTSVATTIFAQTTGAATTTTSPSITKSRMYDRERLDFEVAGHRAFLVQPNKPAAEAKRPWVWYAPTFVGSYPNDCHAWIFTRLLDEGVFIAGIDVGESYGNPEGRRIYQALYETLTRQFKLDPNACLLPQSRGGLMLYNWAAEHPEQARCVGGIYSVCDLSSWPGLEVASKAYGMSVQQMTEHLAENNPIDRLAPLAKAKVPIFHIHGNADTVVPLDRNAGELVKRYRALGGSAELEIVPGKGHAEIPEFFHSQRLVDFFLEQSKQK
jgi:hypothetical protein